MPPLCLLFLTGCGIQDKLQLAAELSAATAIADEIQQEGCKYAVSMKSLKFEALERERTARNTYNDSLTIRGGVQG